MSCCNVVDVLKAFLAKRDLKGDVDPNLDANAKLDVDASLDAEGEPMPKERPMPKENPMPIRNPLPIQNARPNNNLRKLFVSERDVSTIIMSSTINRKQEQNIL